MKLEEKLGHKPTAEERRNYKIKKTMEIKMYANHMGYSDVNPYEVVRTISAKCVEVRAMNAELVKAPKDFRPGGFVGTYVDQDAQEWKITASGTSESFKIRFSNSNSRDIGWYSADGRRFVMSDKPCKFYDYNF